jgi:hypothetical protein
MVNVIEIYLYERVCISGGIMKRFDSLLDKLGSHYCQTLLPENSGSFFKYKKVNGDFIHTECVGSLIPKLSLSGEVLGNTLDDVLPKEMADYKRLFYQKAWEGKTTAYKGQAPSGVDYIAYLVPQIVSGKVEEVYGYGIDISKWDFEDSIITLQENDGVVKYISENAVEIVACELDFLLDNKVTVLPEFKQEVEEARTNIVTTKKAQHTKSRLIINNVLYTLLSIGIPLMHEDKVVCIITFSEIISKC